MWQFFESFNDPRWRQERRFVCIFLPIILVLTAAFLFFLLQERLFPVPEPAEAVITPASSGTRPAPAPAPIPVATPAPTNLGRGEVFLDQGDLTSARVYLSKALLDDGDKAAAFNGLGRLELMEENPEQAVRNFTEALALESGNPLYFYNRAEALRALGQPEKALADLHKARDLDRINPLYGNKILLARMEAGEKKAVFREVQTALEMNLESSLADWLGGAAAIEMEAGNTQHAVAYFINLRELVTPATFRVLVLDRFFDRYRNDPEYAKLIPREVGP